MACQIVLRLYPSSAQKLVLHGSISVKAEDLTVAHKALCDVSPRALSDLTSLFSACHSSPATLASSVPEILPMHGPASGPLHLLFLPAGILLLSPHPTPNRVLHEYLPLLQCQVSYNVTCFSRPVLIILYKPIPLVTLSPDFALFFLIALEVFRHLSVYHPSLHQNISPKKARVFVLFSAKSSGLGIQ